MERTAPERRDVVETYREGVVAVCDLAARVSDWSCPTPCPQWQAIDLVGHLRCMAENFHEYLNEAPDSRLARLFAHEAPAALMIRQISRQNAAELAVLPPASGNEHVLAFAISSEEYLDRLDDTWDEPYLSYRGSKYTAGEYAGAICVEWHLHAWDLAKAIGEDHRPQDPWMVERAWRMGVPHLPLVVGEDPWKSVLRASGRHPGWSA